MDPARLTRLIDRVAESASAPKVIRAYHGSPYDFDRFDASKIGTGEGAQVYGHGLYFAGKEAVADAYRRKLAGEPLPVDLAVDGEPVFRKAWQSLPPLYKDGTNYLMSRLRNYSDTHASDALQEMRRDLPALLEDAMSQSIAENPFARETRINELRGALDLLTNRRVSVLPAERPGKTYEVEIGYPEDAMLDWDRPLASQGAPVSERLAPFRTGKYDLDPKDGTDYETGATALHRIAGALDDDMREASAALVKAGIPGVRYWDRGSRSAGQGTRNYVVFPGAEDAIKIIRKFGWLLPATMAADAVVNADR